MFYGGWTDDRVATLRKGWAEGLSASQIARQLGGVSRNAVIGKVHRLGLAGRVSPSRPAKRPARTSRPRVFLREARPRESRDVIEARAAKNFAEAVARSKDLKPVGVANGRLLDVLGLTARLCRFPIGDPKEADFAFCGRDRGEGCGPYCSDHAALCYAPSKKRDASHEADVARVRAFLDTRDHRRMGQPA